MTVGMVVNDVVSARLADIGPGFDAVFDIVADGKKTVERLYSELEEARREK